MKRIIAFALLACMLVLALASCGPATKEYKLAIGTEVVNKNATIETEQTVAALVLDKDDKIVACRIDSLAVKATITDGAVDAAPTYKTKMELGDDYGMLGQYGSTLAEWDDQVKAFESFVVGKTQAEVAAITGEESDLVAGCTIAINAFLTAIDNAFKDEYKVAFTTTGEVTLGVAMNGDVKENQATANFTTDVAAVAMVDSKVVAATIDSIDASIAYADGAGTEFTYAGSKREQGDDYGMLGADYGSELAEWYDQAQAYANSAVGKTTSELAGLAIEGVTGCTIYAGGYKAVIEKAAGYAR